MAAEFIVRNFKAIKEARVLVEGVTVLQGPSSAGKSSFFQAIQAAATNRFKASQVRHGEDCAEVLMRFTDRTRPDNKPSVLKVTRSYIGGSPVYQLDGARWTKLNRNLPIEVDRFLNLGTISVSSSDFYSLSFFQQFQPPMLKEFSQKKVMDVLTTSKAFDDLIAVKKELDLRRVKVQADFEAIDAVLTQSKARMTEVDMDLQSLDTLDLIKGKLDSLKLLDQEIENHERVLALQRSLRKSVKKQLLLQSLIANRKDIDSIENETYLYKKLAINVSCSTFQLKRKPMLSRCISLQKDVTSLQTLLTEYGVLRRLLLKVYDTEPLKKVISLKERETSLRKDLDKLNLEIESLKRLSTILQYYSTVMSRVRDLRNIKENNICPCCGGPLH